MKAIYFNNAIISFSILNGFMVGAYRFIGFPSEEIKNFVKFHFIFFPNKPLFVLFFK